MSERAPARNRLGLLVAGLVLLVGGGIGAIAAKQAAESQAFSDELTASFNNQLIDVAPDYAAMWVCIVIATIGAIALIVRAATHQAAPTKSEDSTGAA